MPGSALTGAQRRLWELESSGAPPAAHTFSIAWSLRGTVDRTVLEASVRAVAARHRSLRWKLTDVSGEPHLEEIETPPVLGIREAQDIENALREEASVDARAGGRLWRAVLLCSPGVTDSWLLLQVHHLVADRWSVAVFAADLSAAYEALLHGRAPFEGVRSAPDRIPESDRAEDLNWWRDLFRRPAGAIRLPSAAAGCAGYAGCRLDWAADSGSLDRLKALALAENTTIFPVLLTAFAATLHAHTGQDDLVLCTPVAGRHRAGTRSLIGYVNNIVPLRLSLTGDPDFRALIARVTAHCRDAFLHQSAPFHALAALSELQNVRPMRCLFAVQNIPGLNLRLPGVESDYRDIPNGTANFDFSLFVEERNGALAGFADVKTGLMTSADGHQLCARYLQLLETWLADPDLSLSALPRWATAERLTEQASSEQPSNELERRLVSLWQDVLRVPVDPKTNFFEAGGDSIKAARLFSRIEAELGRELPLASLFTAPTPHQFANCLRDEDWAAPWFSLVPVREGDGPPLIMVHGGGGNVLSFQRLASCLPAGMPFYLLQAKGLQRGERPLESIPEMAEYYLHCVRSRFGRGPWLFAGHSAGALIAWELARLATEEGELVPFLALLDCAGPDAQVSLIQKVGFYLGQIWSRGLGGLVRVVIRTAKWWWVTAQARLRMHRLVGTLHPHVEVLASALRAIESYQIPSYNGAVWVYRALQSTPRILCDPLGGWGRVATGKVHVVDVPGDHLTLLEDPNVFVLGRAIAESATGSLQHSRSAAATS